MTIVWGVLLAAAILWPGRIPGGFQGAPLELPAGALAFAVVLPLLWVLHPSFLKTTAARALVVALLAWKLLAWTLLPQGGWCGEFLQRYPPPGDSYRLARGWDARTFFGDKDPPRCTAIVSRGYTRTEDFPAWIINMGFPHDSLVGTGPQVGVFVENPRPPNADFAMTVHGFMHAPARGAFSVLTSSETALEGAIDGRPIAATRGETAAATLDAGPHEVVITLTLTAQGWRFVPLWNGADAFTALATSTTPMTTGERIAMRAGRFVAPMLALWLIGWWALAALRALRPDRTTLAAVGAVSAAVAAAVLSGHEPTVARWASLLLVVAVAIPIADRLRDTRGAWLLVGVPWLALIAALAVGQVGAFTLFTFGDDTLTFQRFAYRIFMQGFWLEGGQRTFWNQPLYRWIVGALHMVFGDSSAGELILDGFAVIVGAVFAFEVVRRLAGFRIAVAAAVLVVLTTTLSTTWYFIGRGLSEIAAAMWVYLAALALLRARDGSIRFALAAGVFAALAFFTRLNHLPLMIAMTALLVADEVTAGDLFDWRAWSRIPIRSAAAYLCCIAVAVAAFAARTWYYTGELSVFAGTTRLHNGTGLGVTWGSWVDPQAWRNAIESVLMIVTVQDPPRFDVRSVPVMAGFACAVLALFRAPVLRTLPLGVVVMCVGAVAGGLVARGVAYPGRFSVHLIPVAVAISVSAAALVGATFKRPATEALAQRWPTAS